MILSIPDERTLDHIFLRLFAVVVPHGVFVIVGVLHFLICSAQTSGKIRELFIPGSSTPTAGALNKGRFPVIVIAAHARDVQQRTQ